jgi:uncharacterized protein (TIGR04222 family)
MTAAHEDLRNRIEAFEIDGSDPVALSFAARLAREHGWPRDYAHRVVREYKRFVFLAMTAGDPVCPSEDVDAAWHLHLTYTRSYWQRFCNEVLGKPLHHDPTRGGSAEQGKHLRMYAFTFAAYRKAFGADPPADVWPDAESRFGDDAKQRTVNTARNWVVPKAVVRRWAAIVSTAATALVFATGCVGGLNPFDLVGMDFLYLLVPLMVVTVALGLVYRKVRKGSGFDGEAVPDLDWRQAAYLSGGPRRLFSAAIARLVQTKAIKVDDDSLRAGNGPTEIRSTVEQEILAALPVRRKGDKGLAQLAKKVKAAFEDDAAKLNADGLVFTNGGSAGIGCLTALPLFAVLAGLAVPRLVFGIQNHKPILFLAVTLGVGLVASFILQACRPLRTRKGDQALDKLKIRHTDLLRVQDDAPEGMNLGLAVALFGTVALAGAEYAALRTWYPRQSSGDGGWNTGCGSGCNTSGTGCSSGGSGCSSGGDGGGSGCGGCGGGGCGGGGGD